MPTDQGLQPSRVEALALKVLLTDPSHLEVAPATEPGPAPGDVGELAVSQRPYGLYAILDGHRRATLLRMVYGDLYTVDCQIYEGLSADQEADIAHALNAPPASPPKQRKPTPLDRFLARRAQGDEAAATITKLATSLGWEISERQTTTNIVAIASLEHIFHGGGEPDGDTNSLALWQTLYAVTRVWGHQRDAVNGDVLLGIGLALLRKDGRMNLDALIKCLTRYKGGPRGLLEAARDTRRHRSWTVAQGVADTVIHLYDSGRQPRPTPGK